MTHRVYTVKLGDWKVGVWPDEVTGAYPEGEFLREYVVDMLQEQIVNCDPLVLDAELATYEEADDE
jgi:hypothetical protein